MLWAVLIIPAAAGAGALLLGAFGRKGSASADWARTARRGLLLGASAAHLAAVAGVWLLDGQDHAGQWLAADGPGKLFLTITSVLFLAVSLYTVGYLRHSPHASTHDAQEGFLFTNEPEAVFIACLLGFLATMSLVCVSQHLGLLWVAVEATTLVSAPLIYFHRHHRSLEAVWKYLLICSVGIAIAMLGNLCLAFAARGSEPAGGHAAFGAWAPDLLAHARSLDPRWLKAAFVMLLVGYGTKMGLAPMHTWLPDAHSEAPAMVSALLSGALLNCAFLPILRAHTLLSAAGMGSFSGGLLVLLGLLSMTVAATFLIRQSDYKRLLAYSSIEHMGILAVGVGLGGLAYTGSMLHAVNHSLTKGLLFLVAGNVLAACGTKNVAEVRGLLRERPLTGALWLGGFLAVVGSPPFGPFLSELVILRGALEQGRWFVAGGYLLALGVIFVAMARVFLPMVFGAPSADRAPKAARESVWAAGPPLALGLAVLVLGLWVPQGMWSFLLELGRTVGMQP